MKVTKIETLSCDGGWRTQNFVKMYTDEGISDDVPWRDEIVTAPMKVKDGFLELPTRPGLGVDLNEDAIAAHLPKIWRD
jgi:L-alanine-DL-glutamate epimerase-like enolase superfamily enzyme